MVATRRTTRQHGAQLLWSFALCAACSDAVPTGTAPPPPAPPAPAPPPVDTAHLRSAHVVAPDGRPGNSGWEDSPWDLATALAGAGGRITPGDTVWVRGGTYRGSWVSTVAGAPGAPILVRSRPGERATLTHEGSALSTLSVRGNWVTFCSLEVTNADPVRTSPVSGSERRPNAVVNSADHVRYLHLLVHDAGVAFFNYAGASDVEVSGSVLYNNGWQGPDRGHGHGLYVKSDGGPVTLRHNVVFNQYGWGVHAYSDLGGGRLDGIVVEENALFNNGALATTATGENLLLGGQEPSTGSRLRGNRAWMPSNARRANIVVGHGATENGSVVVEDNVAVGGDPVLSVGRWANATLQGNTLAGAARLVQLNAASAAGFDWGATRQSRDPLALAWEFNGLLLPFALWVVTTGLGLADIVSAALPSAPEVVVWPDLHEAGRAIAVVLNWSRAATATIPLGGVLAPGDSFEVRNAQAPFDPPVAAGTSTGSVTLPMGGVAPPVPVGLTSSRAPRTGPEFDVFLIIRK